MPVPSMPLVASLREQLVGLGFLVERVVEHLLRVAEPQLVGERTGGAVGGDLCAAISATSLTLPSPPSLMTFSPSAISPFIASHCSCGTLKSTELMIS